MKRIGVLVSVAALFLACVVPAGAYQWNGDSFLDDYYGATLLDAEFDAGHFELGPLVGAKISVSGDHTGSYTMSLPSWSIWVLYICLFVVLFLLFFRMWRLLLLVHLHGGLLILLVL